MIPLKHQQEMLDSNKKYVVKQPTVHKVDQHCSLSECGKTTHKDNRSPVWKGVNCPDCIRVRKPRGKRKY